MAINFIINLVMMTALNQLWSVVNGLQVATHLLLFNLKFPANASFMLSFMINVATFDLLPVEAIWFFFDFPEKGSFNLNFSNSGYDYIFLIENMGTQFFFVQIYLITCLITLVISLVIRFKKAKKLEKANKSL